VVGFFIASDPQGKGSIWKNPEITGDCGKFIAWKRHG
jgi:predicted transglutaminase-like cysteine proteinase